MAAGARRAGRRGKKRPSRSAWVAAVGAFLLICGLVLAFAGVGNAAREKDVIEEHHGRAQQALTAAHMAEQAMDAENYGQARAHLQEARRQLVSLLSEDGTNDREERR